MVWLILLIFSLVMTIGGAAGLAFGGSTEAIPALIFFAILDIVFFKKYSDKKSGKADKRKQEKKESKELQERTVYGLHQAGLPLAQDAACTIADEGDSFKISGGGNNFELQKRKITSIDVKTDVEIQKQYVSSAGGAIAGAMVFGALGAIVGGRTKEKKTTETTYYLIFTYRSNNEISYISFEIQYGAIKKIDKWKNEVQGNFEQTETIEL